MNKPPHCLSAALLLLALLSCAGGSGGAGEVRPDGRGETLDGLQPLEISLDSPIDGQWFSYSPILVSGRLDSLADGEVLVNGATAAVVAGRFSSWLLPAEGDNPVTVSHSSGASVSLTIHVDRLPPALMLTSPGRGTVLAQAAAGLAVSFTAADENGLSALAAGGLAQAVGGGSSQTVNVSVPVAPGLNLLPAEATDGHGNLAREHRAALAGPFLDCDELGEAPTAVVVLGPQALSVIGAAASKALATVDLGAYLADLNPLYASAGFLVTLDSLWLTAPVLTLSTGGTKPDRLSLSCTCDLVEAQGTVQIGGSPPTVLQLDVTLSGLELSSLVGVELTGDSPPKIAVLPEQVEIAADSLALQAVDDQGNEVLAPAEVSGNFMEAIGKLATDIAGQMISETLGQALPSGAGTQELELLALPVSFSYELLDLSVGAAGVLAALAARGEVGGAPLHAWTHGCLGPAPEMPAVQSHPGLQLWLSYPFLNSLFLAAWQQGLLDFHVDQPKMDAWKSQITLVCGMLGSLAPEWDLQHSREDPLVVDVRPRLPPVISSSKTLPGGLAVSLGDFELAFRCGADPAPVATAFMSAELAAGLAVAGGKLRVGLSLDRLLLDTEGLVPQAKRVVERELEVFFEQTIQQMASTIAGALVSLDFPGLYGFVLLAGTAGTGKAPAWFAIQAAVAEEAP